jgi:hypothetical protein
VLFFEVPLIRELHAKNILSKDQFADAMEVATNDADAKRDPLLARTDLMLFRNLVKLLRDPKSTGWTPVVIEGGLSPDKEDGSSR